MSLLTLIAALLLHHFRPLSADLLEQVLHAWSGLLERNFNDSQPRHGILAWGLAVLLPVLLIAGAWLLLDQIGHLPAILLGIAVLFLTLRPAGFAGKPERIARALRGERLEQARESLRGWQGDVTESYSAPQVARVGIETTLLRAHHDLFAPILWFVLLGPAGALLYRLSDLLRREWGDIAGFGDFTRQAFDWLDWLPARFTAGAFAIMGDFEDAVFCWRTQAATWPEAAAGMILASGAGALGVRLGEPLQQGDQLVYRPELGIGDDADADYLESSIGLVWRVLVLIIGMLLLLTFAHWLGN